MMMMMMPDRPRAPELDPIGRSWNNYDSGQVIVQWRLRTYCLRKQAVIPTECQGANASSTALSMLEQLYKPSGDHIPPVVVFTFVGGEAELWLAYCSPAKNKSTIHVKNRCYFHLK
jgi:hypothetical protein